MPSLASPALGTSRTVAATLVQSSCFLCDVSQKDRAAGLLKANSEALP